LGSIHVTEGGNERIQVFDAMGRYVMQWTPNGTGFRSPEGIAIDPTGLAYVTFPAYGTDDRVEKFGFPELSGTITVTVNGDITEEVDEYFTLNLSNPVGLLLDRTSATGTIMNDDTLVTLSVIDTLVTEGNSGITSVSALVQLSHSTSHAVTFNYHTVNGTALGGTDYVAASGAVTIEMGDTEALIPLEVNGDTGPESDEAFTLVLTDPVGAAIERSTATVFILDDETARELSIGDHVVVEGDGGTQAVNLTVTLSAPRLVPVSVSWATRDSTTNNYLDYVPASGNLKIMPGYTHGTITINIVGDEYKELDEIFAVRLSEPVHAAISDRDGVVTILDDGDSQFAVWMGGGSTLDEGDSGTKPAIAMFNLSAPAASGMSVSWATADGSATVADNDYIAASGTYDIPIGATYGTITGLQVVGDTTAESDEYFRVNLTGATGAVITQPLGAVNIRNDDAAIPNVYWTRDSNSVTEGNSEALEVALSRRTEHEVHVYWHTVDGTATAVDSDYVAASGMLIIPPNTPGADIMVSTIENALWEPTKSFQVVLTGASYAIVTDTTIVVNITDDDPLPAISFTDTTVTEGDSGRRAVNLVLTISQAMDSVVTVDFETDPGTAYHYSDFVDTSGTVAFGVGETAETLTVYAKGDTTVEADEVFYVEYSNPHLARFPSSDHKSDITIHDDDFPKITVSDVSITEGNTGAVTASVQVSLSVKTAGDRVRVQYFTRDGTATVADGDYVAESGTLEFSDYQTVKTLSIIVNSDRRREPDQTFELVLRNPKNGTLADSVGVVTIVNDDTALPTVYLASTSIWEGNSGARTATVQASLNHSTDYIVTANWQTRDGSASVSGGDYDAASGVLSFAPGVAVATIDVQVNGDVQRELEEWFEVVLSDPAEAVLEDTTATVMIRNDEGLSIVSILDASMSEGNIGLGELAIPMNLTHPIDVPFQLTVQTIDGTATATDHDYVPLSGVVEIEPAAAAYELKWGTLGTGNGQFNQPGAVAIDSGGVVYVIDAGNNRIQKFDRNGTFLGKWGSAGTGNGQFSDPQGLAVDDSSNVYVVDTGNDRVQKFDKDGNFIKKWSSYHYDWFDSPRCAAFDLAGYLYVTDYGNGHVVKFDRNGTYMQTFDITVHGIAFSDSGYVYTTGPVSGTVDKLTPEFESIVEWGGVGSDEPLDTPMGIAVSHGGVYVADSGNNRIALFDGGGTFVAEWGGYGTGDGRFRAPEGIAVGDSLGFYVADTNNNRIQKFHRAMTVAACTLQVRGDYHYELDETLTVTLSNPQGILLDRDTAVVAIGNDDPVPAIYIAGASLDEGNSGATPADLEVRLSAPSAFDATVDWATEDSTAVSGADYLAASGTLTIPAGDSLATITVAVVGDVEREADEAFKVVLSSPDTATIAADVAVVAIRDDDVLAAVNVADATMSEGNSGDQPLSFLVSLSDPIDAAASFSWEAVDGSASEADSDYVAAGGTHTIAPPLPAYALKWGSMGTANGMFQRPHGVAVAANGSVYVADRDNSRIQRFSPSGAFELAWGSYGSGNGQFYSPTGVALDDSGNVYVADDGRSNVQKFTSGGVYIKKWSVTSGAYGIAIDEDGSVFVTTGNYYVRKYTRTGTLLMSWGSSGSGNGQFSDVRGVAVDQDGYVYVADSGNRRVQKFTGTGTYVTKWGTSGTGDGQFSYFNGIAATPRAIYVADTGNDRIQKFDHSGVFICKWGTSGAGDGQFTRPRGVALNDNLDVYISDTNNDRIQKFGHGMPAADSIDVLVKGDVKYEADEMFTIELSNPVGANLWRASATGTILNDDAMPVVSVTDVSVPEGTGIGDGGGLTLADVTIELSAASTMQVTVGYRTEDSTATVAGHDYIAVDSTATFEPGDTSVVVPVWIRTDYTPEPDEILKVVLTGATEAALGDSIALVTILNDDTTYPALTIADTSVAEGDTLTTVVNLLVETSFPLQQPIVVYYRTEDSTATAADLDFDVVTDSLVIPANDTSGVIQVIVRGDRKLESDEVFRIVLYEPEWAMLEDSVGVVAITNDDGMPMLTIAGCMIVEGDAGPRGALMPVSLSRPAGVLITARWHTVDSTATAGDADYTAVSDSVIFAPGDTLKFATVNVLGDARAECNEMFRVVVSSASGAILSDTTATITIVNDDLPVVTVTDASVTEGGSGATPVLVVVSLSGPVSHDVTVEYRTQDSTATVADLDYVAMIDTLTFSAGAVAETLMVTVNGDTLPEPDERLWVVLSNPGGSLLADSIGAITILNDDAATAVDDTPPVRDFALLPPYPNPTSGNMVHFQFELPRQDHVQLFVYDVAGRQVARLVDSKYPLGRHQIVWNCRSGERAIATGVYFVRFSSGGRNFVRRVVLIR
jgi:hypothetical protein